MSFLDQIEKVQKKPRHVREKILATSVITIMILVVIVWFQTAKNSFSQETKVSAGNPLQVLWSTASDGWNAASGGLKDIFNQLPIEKILPENKNQ